MAKSTPTTSKRSRRRPRVLVLEALTGSSRAITRAGGVAISADPRNGSKRTLDLIESDDWDALLLTGGSDVDPRRYGAKRPHRTVYGVNQIRDEVETYALEFARERNVPVLGICRGAQMINVEAGGTLVQHIGEKHRSCWHPVVAAAGSLLAAAAGDKFRVRSLHHQKIRQPAPGFAIVGHAHDGTAEAIESEDGRCLGVQFHPEMDTGARYAQGIFRWLVLEAANRAGLAKPRKPKRTAAPRSALEFGRMSRGYSRDGKRRAQLPLFSSGTGWIADDDPRQLAASTVDGKPRRSRQAGTRQFRTTGRSGPVKVSYVCPNCATVFEGADALDNRAAHIAASVCG